NQIFKQDSFSRQMMKKLILRNSLFLKLIKRQKDPKIIGYITLIRSNRNTVCIINFSIKKECQNKGYGSYLLQNTLEIIKKFQDIKKIILNVNIKNEIAIKVYKKFEFQIVKEIENYYSNHETAYLMEKIL
ncbi:MAG: GNAT family N-acetyltransferase, partial [Candidatus Heimdallarchaeota archaeon]